MADGRPFDDVNADIRALNNELARLFSQSRRLHTRATSIRATLSGEHPNPFEEELNRLERVIEETFRPDEPDQEKPEDLIEDCEMVGKQIELAYEELSTRWDDASAELRAVRNAVKTKGESHHDYRRLRLRVEELEHITDEYHKQNGIIIDLSSRSMRLDMRIGDIWRRDFAGDVPLDMIRTILRAEALIEERFVASSSSCAEIDRQLEAIVAELDAEERKYSARRNEEIAAGHDTSSTDSCLAVIARERAIIRRALAPAPTSNRSIIQAIRAWVSVGHRPSSSIASFRSFAGFSLGDPASAVATRLGRPQESDTSPNLTQYTYGNGSVLISVHDRVFSVWIMGAEGVDWLRGHGITDRKLELIGKTKSEVLASYGAPASVESDNYTYSLEWGEVTFICYEHNGYICTEISVNWY
jgi:hypothetical protein